MRTLEDVALDFMAFQRMGYRDTAGLFYSWARGSLRMARTCEPWMRPILIRKAYEHRDFARGMRDQARRIEAGR